MGATGPGASPKHTAGPVLIWSNVATMLVTGLISTSVYFADMLGNKAASKQQTKLALAEIAAESDAYRLQTEAHKYALESAQAQYSATIEIIGRNCKKR